MFHLEPLQHRRLVILLTLTQFFHNACLFKFSLKLLESSFDILTIFNWYNYHAIFVFNYLYYTYIILATATKCGAKLHFIFEPNNFSRSFLCFLLNFLSFGRIISSKSHYKPIKYTFSIHHRTQDIFEVYYRIVLAHMSINSNMYDLRNLRRFSIVIFIASHVDLPARQASLHIQIIFYIRCQACISRVNTQRLL